CSIPFPRPPWSKIMNRVLVVPWSSAAAKSAMGLLLLLLHPSVAGPGVGDRLHQQPRGRRAGFLVPGAPFAEVARAALAGDERDRGLHALLGRHRRTPQGVGERRPITQPPPQATPA